MRRRPPHCASNARASQNLSARKVLTGQTRRFPTPELPGAWPKNPGFRMECDGLPWQFARSNGGLGRSQTGSALHHLVTAVSVKKTLMRRLGNQAVFGINYWLKHR